MGALQSNHQPPYNPTAANSLMSFAGHLVCGSFRNTWKPARLDSSYTMSSTSSHYCLKPTSKENTTKRAKTTKNANSSQMSSLPSSSSKENSKPLLKSPPKSDSSSKIKSQTSITEANTETNSESEDENSENEQTDDAPVELKAEFIECLQSKDWVNALKLCKMILLYEPENPTASEYIAVLEERIQLDEEASTESSSGEDDSSDDDEDDSDENEDEVSSNGDNEQESLSEQSSEEDDRDNMTQSDVVISIKK
ncbi:uncharacterized protein LOC142349390 [Convolutriloba macropyga]|uniref:uncharacterized protein LOC142349390 n=1 Tax=Convolutriloba macropyga TaxID=536237 RepID=UPI003F526636